MTHNTPTSGHCLENCTGSRLEFEDGTTSSNSTLVHLHQISRTEPGPF